jgi:hypothetical protein
MDELDSEEEYQDDNEAPKAKRGRKQKVKAPVWESVVIPLGDKSAIDKFVSWKFKDGKYDILVKYKSMGYIHCDWVPKDELETDKSMKTRIRKFLEKPLWETQWSDDEPFNPAYNKIDRIIDEGEMESGKVFYLVKWCAQTYDLCTWEEHDVVQKVILILTHFFF